MFCPNCGKKLEDGALFCSHCGAKVLSANETTQKEENTKKKKPEVKPNTFKCPYCGEILPFDAVTCPSCGKEIRGKDAVVSVSKLSMKLLDVEDEDEKIMLIKTFPIPNAREDILEFMILATTSFDAKYYISNRQKDSVASAWLTKIDQCYKKAQIMLMAKRDLEQVEKLYQEVQKKIKSKSILKLVFIICGFLFIGGGTALILALGQSYTFVTLVGIILVVLGILGLVFGFKKKKTNKEIAEEKARQQKLEELRINADKDVRIANIEADKDARAAAYKSAVNQGSKLDEDEINNHFSEINKTFQESFSSIMDSFKAKEDDIRKHTESPKEEIYREPVEYSAGLVFRPNEKIVLRKEAFVVSHGDFDRGRFTNEEWVLVLTDQALLYIRGKSMRNKRVERVPFSQINKIEFHRGGRYFHYSFDVVRADGVIDRISGNKRVALWNMALQDRFNPNNRNRDFNYYARVNVKAL